MVSVNICIPPTPAASGKAVQLLSVNDFLYSSTKTQPLCAGNATLKLLAPNFGCDKGAERTGDPSDTSAILCAPPALTAMMFVAVMTRLRAFCRLGSRRYSRFWKPALPRPVVQNICGSGRESAHSSLAENLSRLTSAATGIIRAIRG